jgi:HlyD family secretion protein
MPANDSPPNTRRTRIARALMVLAALGAAAFFARNLVLGKPVQTVAATRGALTQTVVASGRLVTPQRVSVGTTITERVARIPVEEGQVVKRGEVLIVLDDTNERAALAEAQAAVAQAQAKLRQLREVALPAAEQTLAQARANALQARQNYERTTALREKGFVGQAQQDDARRALDVAESQLRAAELQIASNRPTGSDYAMAQTALEQAQASLASAQAKLAQTVIYAPADGVLISRNVEPGNVVQPGKELMALAPSGETQIVVQIDEKNLSLLALGQQALASADAFPDKRFAAEVIYINPGVDPLRGSVEVKLRVPQPPAFLRQDMTVSVDIEVAHRSDTVIVPADAVRDATGAQPWVLALNGHRAVRRPVKLGLRGDSRIEILAGVAAGDMLIPSTDALVKPGERVRAAR